MEEQGKSDLVVATEEHVRQHMSLYDASHDFEHVQRVLRLAQHIAATENSLLSRTSSPSQPRLHDLRLVTLAALLHDVGDSKYLGPGQDGSQMAAKFLLDQHAPAPLAEQVQMVVNAVSYSGEIKDPDRVTQVLRAHPELGPVQDADRLDALGAIGIGRCFTYLGAKGRPALDEALEHFDEKLLRLASMMKTDTGRALARARSDRLKVFRQWWADETRIDDGQAWSSRVNTE